jgi:hypothetical protein
MLPEKDGLDACDAEDAELLDETDRPVPAVAPDRAEMLEPGLTPRAAPGPEPGELV